MVYKISEIMRVVDHSGLKPYATNADIKRLLDEAAAWGTYSVCIEPLWAEMAKAYMKEKGYDFKIDLALDFPFGVLTTPARLDLINRYAGVADEVDLVVQVGYVRSGMFEKVKEDVDKLVEAAHRNNMVVKFITEDAYTTYDQKRKLYEIICGSEADFIKTSTGFAEEEFARSMGNERGAAVENVKMMAETAKRLNSSIGIKVAGGIRTYRDAVRLFEASERPLNPKHFRLGVSATEKIRNEMISLGLPF